jgi:hypothetical protein
MEEELLVRRNVLKKTLEINGWDTTYQKLSEVMSTEDKATYKSITSELNDINRKLMAYEINRRKKMEEDRAFEEEVKRRVTKELFERRVNAEVQRRLAAIV